jgi:hypothetical protein
MMGVKPMSEKHLIEAVARRFKEMPRKKRVASIRKLASQSAADERFVRRYFPDLFNEAFRPSAAGARSGSARPRARHATPR